MSNINLNTHDQYVPYAALGSGSQFRTFDLHNGRVLKIPLTKAETLVVQASRRHNMRPLNKTEQVSADNRMMTAINGKARIKSMVMHNLQDRVDFLKLIGNPELLDAEKILPEDEGDKQWGAGRVIYTQRKLNMIGDMLNAIAGKFKLGRGDINQIKMMIDAYVETTHKIWEYGYADYVFKIGDSGITEDSQLIVADIGEMSGDFEFVSKILADRRWMHATDPMKIDFPQIPRQVQDYYEKTLDNAFTQDILEEKWRKKHICTNCDTKDDALSAFIAAKIAEIDYVDRW